MNSLRRLLPYLYPYRRRYLGGILLTLLAAAISVVTPLLLKQAFEALERPDASTGIGRIVFFLLALAAGRAFLAFRSRYAIIGAARHVEYDLRNHLYRHLLSLPASFFDRHSSGDLASRMINDLEGIRMVAGAAVAILTGTIPLFFFSLAAMFWLQPALAAICLVPLLLVSAVTALFTPAVFRLSRLVQDRLSDVSERAQENFTGARVVRAFAQEEAESRRLADVAAHYRTANLRLTLVRGMMNSGMTFFLQCAVVVTLLFGGSRIIAGGMSPGDFLAFSAYLFLLVWPVIAIGWVVGLFQRGAACMQRLGEILDAAPDEPLRPAGSLPPSSGALEIRNLTFHYQDDRPPALRNLSLKIAAGERVALVGRTGSGKSTLLQILLGLYRPAAGTVFLDGRDINLYARADLRSAIAGVPQDLFLFSDSLRENIAFGGTNGVTDEGVRNAAELARIAGDAGRFPQGLQQVIGERGITLSGGQKQRTALARALVRRPQLLLLDDALSSVDVRTEREILDALEEVLQGRTCLIATHRLSIIPQVDRILVLDEGHVIEEGTHEALMKKRGLYASFVERQQLEEALS